jgi:RNA polymerase sigma-70 factor (ECF subfamily)
MSIGEGAGSDQDERERQYQVLHNHLHHAVSSGGSVFRRLPSDTGRETQKFHATGKFFCRLLCLWSHADFALVDVPDTQSGGRARHEDTMPRDARDHIEGLIAEVALRDQAAFSSLYDATAAKLLAVCLRVLKERVAAEDALQETFVKVWHNADRYQVTGHSPMTWLITIARNTAIDRARARSGGGVSVALDDRVACSRPTPEQEAVAASEARRITQCLDALDADRRRAVTGAYLDGKSYKDLSEEFSVPLNTMRTWLRRGLASLRECLSR